MLEENTKLNSENKKLKAASGQNEKALNKIQSDFESLKSESAEFIKLKTKYQKTSKELNEKSQRLTDLEEQISRLELYHYIKWFLVGAGVLLLGFIIGFSTKRQRRRASLL